MLPFRAGADETTDVLNILEMFFFMIYSYSCISLDVFVQLFS